MEASKVIPCNHQARISTDDDIDRANTNTPITKNMPKGCFGYSTSGKKPGAMRNDNASFVSW
jgi:hypothetical protein